jgi:hypothetical protein
LVRIRTLLGLAVAVAAGLWAYPRARATVELQTTATVFADYAACMVGPTGPTLLRDNPEEFRHLLRRRVVSALPEERPFQRCAAGAFALTGDDEVLGAHQAQAWSFAEYGAPADQRPPGRFGTVHIDQLRVTTQRLAELAARAEPFLSGGYTRLVSRSAGAPEATHPVALPPPSLGSGLPAWRAPYRTTWPSGHSWFAAFGAGAHLTVHQSTDGGLTWAPVSERSPGVEEHAGRCSAGGHAYELGLDSAGEFTMLASYGVDGARIEVAVADSDRPIVALACDAAAAVIATKGPEDDSVLLQRCPYQSSCLELPLPPAGPGGRLPRFPLDVARIDGTTILAVNMGDVVRVASTRDDGARWTPLVAAFDRGQVLDFEAHVPFPRRLLALGDRLFLYGGAPAPAQTYPVLVSEDQGATWRTPDL